MYYCKNCQKYIKQGNVCDTCGAKMTPKDGIIFCPKCNKSYFNPGMNKKFACQNCGTQIIVNEDLLRKQKGKTEVNKVSDENKQAENEDRFFDKFTESKDYTSSQGQENNNRLQEQNYTNNFNNESNSQNTSVNNEQNYNQQQDVVKKQGSIDKENKQSDNEFDFDLIDSIEDKTEEVKEEPKGKNDKKGKKKDKKENEVVTKNKGNVLSTIAATLVFVLVAVALFYYFVIPFFIPTYKANWDKYITATNNMYQATGVDRKINTVEFKVEIKTDTEVVAIVKVEDKVYDETEESYVNTFTTFRVTFIKKKGEFVISTKEDITE